MTLFAMREQCMVIISERPLFHIVCTYGYIFERIYGHIYITNCTNVFRSIVHFEEYM